jgi:membrane associated rhomboid family serine protease
MIPLAESPENLVCIGQTSEETTFLSWQLTMHAKRIPHRITRTSADSAQQWMLFVPSEYEELGRNELLSLQNEKLPTSALIPIQDISLTPILGVLAAFVVFHMVANQFDIADFYGKGNADSSLILKGQIWRCVTALTLHADGLHLFGNMLFGGWFIWLLARHIGLGASFFLTLWSGILGNVANAIFQSSNHRSIGASTAIFGAMGALLGISIASRQADWFREIAVPCVIGLLLFAFLGIGDKHTDVGAHLFGMITGGLLGKGYLYINKPLSQNTYNFVSVILVLMAWTMALVAS